MRCEHTLEVDVVDAGATLLRLDVALEAAPVRILLVVLLAALDGVGDERRAHDVVARLGLRDVEPVEDRVDLVALELRVDAVLQQRVTRGRLQHGHALVRVARDLDVPHTLRVDDLLDQRAAFRSEVVQARDVGLVEDENGGLVREEGLDGVEELALRLDGVAALLGEIHKVEHARLEVRERGDALHLDVVHLLERVVEDAGGVDDLPAHVAVVEVADEEGLGRERVRLHVDVRARDLVEEGGLADVGVPADEERAGGGVDGGETGEMLADLLEELECFVLPLHDRGHATEGGALELLASVERVAELEETDVILGDLVDEMAGSAELTQRELVVVLVVKNVEQGREKGVQILQNC